MSETVTAQQSNTALLERPQTVRPPVTDELLAGIARRIVAEFHPYRIILFGSYAYGTPHAESDLDLLVVMEKPAETGRYVHAVYDAARTPNLSMDILAYSPAELETRLAMGDFFVRDILARGKMLYDCGAMWDEQEITITMSLLDEWIEKAEEDYEAASVLYRARKKPMPTAVCFHCQQCIEKYLKSILIRYNTPPPRTHDLEELMRLCAVHEPNVILFQPMFHTLTPYAIKFRYPDQIPVTLQAAKEAVQMMRDIRKFVRKSLGM